jgi:1,4-alpha-glucan branching enzyme
MSASQQHITASTPMGANLMADGATFRVWAPGADHVYVAFHADAHYQPDPATELVKDPATGHWTGFFSGVGEGAFYRYYIAGPGGFGFKRDQWARELELFGYPNCNCIVSNPGSYPWHDQDWRPPAFNDLIVYQLHIGVFYARDEQGRDIRSGRPSKFLDVVDRIEYLAALNVNAIQPLPVVEFQGEWSLGYNGSDLFSPEMDYSVAPGALPPYLAKVNALLAKKDCPPLTGEQLIGQMNQLKALIDLCHLYGIAVIPDVVYNHAGGGFDVQGIDYFDFPAVRDKTTSIYFSRDDWAGGRVFDFGRPQVGDFLIHNALMFLQEYHVDGLRFDEVSVIDAMGGWFFAQDLTATLRAAKPEAALIAEYWGGDRWRGVVGPPAGMGFDIGYTDGIRDGVRNVLSQAAGGASADVNLDILKLALERPWGFPQAWKSYHCLENHDFCLDADGDHRKPRIARLAGGDNSRSIYARGRSRAAMGILLTSPGVPMLFMGQEFLEDKLWADNPNRPDLFIWWDGVDGQDQAMSDFHRFTSDLIRLRRTLPALRSEPVNVFHIDNFNRILAFHRWVPNEGSDVVVVISLREQPFTFGGYGLGFPAGGRWTEVFNTDYYDNWPNPQTQGNGGFVWAGGGPMHGLPASAGITIPANGMIVFTRG